MFGYFRPNASPMIGEQRSTFYAYYCRLCYCLRNMGGQAARAMTTFDVTIYSMIVAIAMGTDAPPRLRCEKIRRENMRKFSNDEVGLRIASLSFIAFGEKIRDDMLDGDSGRARFLQLVFGKAIAAAKEREPEMAKIAYEGTELVNVLQQKGAELDEVLSAYGDMTVGSFKLLTELDERYVELISRLAEWTFFVDMLCDYDDDVRDGKPNTFYREEYKTLDEYLDTNWHFVYKKNKELSDRIKELLHSIYNGSNEWFAVYKVVVYALDTVVSAILTGGDVKFHYLRELKKNMHNDFEEKKKFRKREREAKNEKA